MLESYLHNIFQVKALLNEIPKFLGSSSEITKIVRGICKTLLILDAKFEDANASWWASAMSENLAVFYG